MYSFMQNKIEKKNLAFTYMQHKDPTKCKHFYNATRQYNNANPYHYQ